MSATQTIETCSRYPRAHTSLSELGSSAKDISASAHTMTLEIGRPRSLLTSEQRESFLLVRKIVRLADASGKRVDGATVYLEQDMPAMKMASNQPLGEPLGNGQYRLKSLFTMEGAWVVVIHASVAGKEYAATFDQQVMPQT